MAAFGGWRLTRTGVLFVIGILVLGGLVTGGVFLVKNRGETARRDQAVKVAEQNLKDQSSQTPTTNTNSSSSSQTNSQTNTGTTTAPGATSTGSTGSAGSSATTTTASAAPAALPTTGPNTLSELGNILAVTILALSAAFYISSRRANSRL